MSAFRLWSNLRCVIEVHGSSSDQADWSFTDTSQKLCYSQQSRLARLRSQYWQDGIPKCNLPDYWHAAYFLFIFSWHVPTWLPLSPDKSNWQNWGGRWERRTAFMRHLKTVLEELEIGYSKPLQPVVLHPSSAVSSLHAFQSVGSRTTSDAATLGNAGGFVAAERAVAPGPTFPGWLEYICYQKLYNLIKIISREILKPINVSNPNVVLSPCDISAYIR
jgi:hypothetical protein